MSIVTLSWTPGKRKRRAEGCCALDSESTLDIRRPSFPAGTPFPTRTQNSPFPPFYLSRPRLKLMERRHPQILMFHKQFLQCFPRAVCSVRGCQCSPRAGAQPRKCPRDWLPCDIQFHASCLTIRPVPLRPELIH